MFRNVRFETLLRKNKKENSPPREVNFLSVTVKKRTAGDQSRLCLAPSRRNGAGVEARLVREEEVR